MIRSFLSLLLACFIAAPVFAHDSTASYIANAGVRVTHTDAKVGDIKVLFDPLPLSGFGTYMELPPADKTAMMASAAPYDDVNVVFISHAHRDHFSAADMIAFMAAQPNAHMVAPAQARDMMQADPSWDVNMSDRIHIIDMDYGDAPQHIQIDAVKAAAVRIPHSGWPAPRRAIVQNMVYRVTLGDGPTVMHMGDADVRAQHYAPFVAHWQAERTDLAMPPYWFLMSPSGLDILKGINAEKSVGVHVPLNVPQDLKNSGVDYFSVSGESRVLMQSHKE